MNRKLFALVSGVLFCVSAVAQAAVYDNVYWVGGSGEWTGDVTASPEYATGHWSANPNAATGLPAKFVLGRNDGIRTNGVIGNGNYDLDRVPCAVLQPHWLYGRRSIRHRHLHLGARHGYVQPE